MMEAQNARDNRLTTAAWSYDQAYARNLGLIGPDDQSRLRHATIGIPGLGGVGGIHLMTLARMGIGGFNIADADEFSVSNTNRQYGAFVSTVGKDKGTVMASFVRDVNPDIRLKHIRGFIDEANIDEFLSGCDLVLDSLDAWAIETRLLLFRKCREKGIPVISAGPIGFSAAMIVALPGSMSLDSYLAITPQMKTIEKFSRFIIGLTPKPYFLRYMNTGKVDMNQKNGPSVASSVTLCAGFAAVEAMKILLGKGKVLGLPHFHYFDPYIGVFKRGYVPFGNRHPLQRLKIWYLLNHRLKS